MNYLIGIFKSALIDFGKNKGRTFLTSLGILIGVLSVVLLMAAGVGLKEYIKQQFESLGTNLLYVMPGNIFGSGGSFSSAGGIAPLFDEKDIQNLKRVGGAKLVAPISRKSGQLTSEGKTEVVTMYTTSNDFFTATNMTIGFGNLFSESDNTGMNRVAVLGPKLAETIFGEAGLAVGKNVRFEGQSFRVVGVTAPKGGGGLGGPDFDTFIYIPFKTGYIFNPDKKFLEVIVEADSENDLATLKTSLSTQLLKRYKSDQFSVVESTDILNTISSIFNIMNVVLVAIAGISLLVGGIGILNIMYVTVTERIKEIGIRRALGARSGDILWQFMAEAVVLSVFGGAMGLGLAALIVYFIHPIFPAYITLGSIALSLGTSSLIGIVFGVFPAKKASDLSPIDAIRYE